METETISKPISGRMVVVCCQCHEVLSDTPLPGGKGILSHGYCPECASRAMEEFDFYMKNEFSRGRDMVHHHP